MKKIFSAVLVASLFVCVSSSFAARVIPDGEATFVSMHSGQAYVDYIVSDTDLATGIPAANFIFSTIGGVAPPYKGDKAAYDASTYYYYYQIENDNIDSLTTLKQLTLNFFDPAVVISAGFISDADLDDVTTFNHNVAGEHENVSSLRDPDTSDFDEVSFPPNQTWAFSPTELAIGGESTVLFITSDKQPVLTPAYMLDGTPFYGDLYVPESEIPEPFSIMLIGSGLVGLIIKRRKQ